MLSCLCSRVSLPTSFPAKANWGQAPLPRLPGEAVALLQLKSPIPTWLLLVFFFFFVLATCVTCLHPSAYLNRLVLLENQPVLCKNRERRDVLLYKGFSRDCLRMPQVTYSGHHFTNTFSWQQPAGLPKECVLLTPSSPASLLVRPV